MGFFEGIGQICYAMAKRPKHDFIVYDQYEREYTVTAEDAEHAVSKVIRDHPFTVRANRVRARKVR
jgi:hypothetical protein